MKRVLFLDDCPARQKWAINNLAPGSPGVFIAVFNAEEAIFNLKNEPAFDVVYLDHDLGGETYVDPSRPDTGSGVVRWMIEAQPDVGLVVVHTMNTPAGNNMVRDLVNNGFRAVYRSFYDMARSAMRWER